MKIESKHLINNPLIRLTESLSVVIIFSLLILISCQKKSALSSTIPVTKTNNEDGSGAYATGLYRNLFMENGHSAEEIR